MLLYSYTHMHTYMCAHNAATMYCTTDISLVQDDEVGDGTTSVAVLACELLKVSLVFDSRSTTVAIQFWYATFC